MGGSIHVKVSSDLIYNRIIVVDTGLRIPENQLQTITGPFIQGEGDPLGAEKGWGLAITKSLAELHGGQLDIQSQVGKGTTVTILIPNAGN